jgi:tetratricopeptide (TPR) repeat protein
VPDSVEPQFSVFLTGHGAAGARAMRASDADVGDDVDAQASLKVFARAVHVDPNDPDYHFILGQALVEAGRLAEAIPALRRAVALHADAAEYRLCLGQALWHAARFDEAADTFADAARLNPENAAAWSGAGAARLAADDAADSMAQIDEALRLDGRLPDAYNNRGVALWRRGDTKGALAAFARAARLDPGLAFPHHNRGLALLAIGRCREALAALSAAHQRSPQDADLRVDIAETLYRLARKEEAHSAFREALDLSPSCLESHPLARATFLELETAAMHAELPPRRSRVTAALAPVFAVLLAITGSVSGLLSFRHRVASALVFAVLALAMYPLWHLTPVYVRHYLFVDDLGSVAGTPLSGDYEVYERLMRVVQRRGLGSVIDANSCQITSLPKWRTVTCRYVVSVSVLPGVSRRLTFETSVEHFYVATDKMYVPGIHSET